MKKQGIIFIILCLALCASLGFSSPQEEEYYDNSFTRLNYVKGDVYIQRAEDMGYEEATVNLPIVAGDKLGTRDGRVELQFGRRNYLRVDKDTQIDFVKLPQRGDDSISLHLFSGMIYLRINSLNLEKEFELHSPDGSFYVLEEGLYRFEVRETQETALFVVEGSVEAAGEGGFEIVRAGERLVAANGFFTFGPEYVYAGNEDSFSEWNRGRDVFHNRYYVKTRYLPVEMNEYESELDYYGRWVYERPYGYVWIPDVYHYSWRPYYHGRWVWYPVCGWTWCSYEPWGWCVSHYGRWHWRVGLGWYWIPTRGWGPAWVHWYHGIDYVGWSPLSYYNRPVVIVNNRFYGRHYDRDYPVHSRAFTVIRKDQLSARHVSRVALSQSGVSRLGKISLSSKQPGVRPASNGIGVKGSAAAKVLSRSNLRPVSRSYSSGKSIRSSTGKSLAGPTGTSRISTRSGTVSKGRATATQKSVRTTSSERIPSQSLSVGNRSSRSAIKTYPSQRTSVSSSRTAAPSRSRSYAPSSSRSSRSTIKQYSSRSPSSIKSRSSGPARSSYSSALKQYTSQSRSSVSPNSSRRSTSGTSAYRSSPSRSSYSTPSRTSPKIKTSSPRYKSYSPSRVSSSRSSSSSRSFRSTSSSRVSRSSPSRSSISRSSSSRSSSRSSSSRVKKK